MASPASQVIFRYADANNYWCVAVTSTSVVLVSVVAGSPVTRGTGSYSALTVGNVYPLSIVCSGNNIDVTFNGQTIHYSTASPLNTNTQCGLQAAGSGTPASTYDNLLVTG